MNIQRGIHFQNRGYNVDVPDACPICHRHSEVTFVAADAIENDKGVQAIFRCAYAACRQFFFCYYGPAPNSQLLAVRPRKPEPSVVIDAVKQLSPTFASVFEEAEETAQLGLLEAAGPAYRKAFEFLIKDYAKSLAPDRASEIEAKFAGSVVNDVISDNRIQAVARRSLWLGNDETHYLRKWTNHDLTDLVTLIKLTASWIEIEHLSKSYIDSMPDKPA